MEHRVLVRPQSADQAEVLYRVEALEAALAELGALIAAGSSLPAWCEGADDPRAARRLASHAVQELRYADGQGGNESQTLAGIVGIPPGHDAVIGQVNDAKDALKRTLSAFHKLFVTESLAGEPLKPTPYLRYLLGQIGRARLNTQQAYRHIRLIPPPTRAAFSYCYIRKVESWTRAKVRAALTDLVDGFNERAEDDLRRLASTRDTEFAHVTGPLLQVRVNLGFPATATTGPTRLQLACPLPLLYATGHDQPAPVVRPLPARPQPPRLRKRDKVCAERLLYSLPVHRYMKYESGAIPR